MAPSTFADQKNWVRQVNALKLFLHRPPSTDSFTHVSLFSPILGRLREYVDNIELVGADFDAALTLCQTMSNVFGSEDARRDLATDIMQEYFGLQDSLKPHSFPNNHVTDASYHVKCASPSKSGSHFVVSFIREDKNEIGSTSQSAPEQVFGYYLLSLKQDAFATAHSNHPTILVTL